jgi:hypothetical protein
MIVASACYYIAGFKRASIMIIALVDQSAGCEAEAQPALAAGLVGEGLQLLQTVVLSVIDRMLPEHIICYCVLIKGPKWLDLYSSRVYA